MSPDSSRMGFVLFFSSTPLRENWHGSLIGKSCFFFTPILSRTQCLSRLLKTKWSLAFLVQKISLCLCFCVEFSASKFLVHSTSLRTESKGRWPTATPTTTTGYRRYKKKSFTLTTFFSIMGHRGDFWYSDCELRYSRKNCFSTLTAKWWFFHHRSAQRLNLQTQLDDP